MTLSYKPKSIQVISFDRFDYDFLNKFRSDVIISIPFIHAQEINYVTDANGNLVTGDSFYREYNKLNQLIRIRQGNLSSGAILEEFTWHPTEERILVKDVYSNGVKNYTIYYVSKEYLVIENSTGNYTEKYVYQGNDLVSQVTTDNLKQAVHNDHLGSASLVTDTSGNVVENNFYAPFGESLTTTNSRFTYEAKEYDKAVQDIDFHFRKYKPQWGKFTQPDTLIQNVYDPQSLNRYAFERNNPYKYTDPTGHFVFYYGEVGSIGFGTGAQGAFGNVISFSFSNGLQYGTYQRYGAGAMTPTASASVEAGFSPFMKNIGEFKGGFTDLGFDVGQVASVGFGVNIPYDEKNKKFKLSNFVLSGTGSFTDLNPPITPVSGYAVYSNTLVNYRQSNNLRLSSSVLIQNEYLRYQAYFSDKKESRSGGGRSGGGSGGGCACGPWGDLRSRAESNPNKTAGDIIREWRKSQ